MKPSCLFILPATAAMLLELSSFNFSSQSSANASPPIAQSQSQPSQERQHPPRIDFAAAAQQLGVSEAKLVEALGLPAKPPEPPMRNDRSSCLPPPPPRLDIPGASRKLGVTEAQLIKVLGIPPHPPRDRQRPQDSEKT